MKKMTRGLVAVLAASLATAVAGCAAGGSNSGGDASGPLKVGLITDVTGPAAQGQEYAVIGAQARIDALNAHGGLNGRMVKLVVGDTASSPQGTLTAAKKLVQQDHVVAILAWSYLYNAAADFVTSQNIPVFGGAWDPAPGWAEHKNMFGSQPASPTKTIAATTFAKLFKMRDASKVGIVGLDTPSSHEATDGVAQAAKDGGLEVVYQNVTVAPTDNDFTSVALAIKKSGADAVYGSLPSSQIYALAGALRQQDVHLKLYLGATGYGQALLDNPTALAGSEGAVFTPWYAPKELETTATKEMAANLEKYGKYTGSFDFSASGTYLDAVGFIGAADAAKGDLTAEGIMKAARTMDNFDFGGLIAHPVDWSKPDEPNGGGLGYGNCTFPITLHNGAFEPLTKTPLCGTARVVS